ncbi:uncharacterized protein VTP21DRAFT_6083 [Calcarisporiella thermophila]|uniref:uncharacterized protein n=1 Tax=Calcarisporiella thermophila TaxID=911321 RepID=UPI003742B174
MSRLLFNKSFNINKTILTARSYSSKMSPVQNLTVYGSGLMGSGIAQTAAQHKINVTLVDLAQPQLDKALKSITSSLQRIARKLHPDQQQQQDNFVQDTLTRIQTSTDTEKSAQDADLVVEAVVENLELKRELFKRLDAVAKPSAIFCSNTSSLPIGDIALATKRRDKFAGLHFFNPVPQMKLVEVVRTEDTSDEVFSTLVDVCKQMKKVPVACKDTPGFIVNRLLVPYMMESLRLVERGEATMEDVDTAMKLGAGYPMGPFELADFVGLDTLKFIVDGWRQSGKMEEALVAPVKLLDDLVAQGNLGRKTGKGLYSYEAKK